MPQIETSRLWLRPLALTDLDDLASIYSDSEVMKYRVQSEPAYKEQTLLNLESYLLHWRQYGFGRWATIYKASQQFIGHCGLEHVASLNEIELNYLIAREYWGQGLATEAAMALLRYGWETLQLKRLVAISKPENFASRRVMEKIGMLYEKNIQLYGVEWVLYKINHN
jgi:[ribosomal protein S5]-alanine N-acetyltransferase